MTTRSAFFWAGAITLLAASGCNEASTPSSPPPIPPVPPGALGVIVGRISGDTITASFTPAGNSMYANGTLSPAIYGNQGVTVTVTGVVDSQVFYAPDSTKWFTHVKLRNLLTNKIGTNYAGATPLDSSGVFAFFLQNPQITLPAGCGCTVTMSNAAGVENFTAPGQSYFWYNSIPTAVQGAPGTDTTASTVWIFKANKSIAHAFIFVLEVSTMWPPPAEATWTVKYDGTTDSLPFSKAEPRWKPNHFQNAHVGTAVVTWNATGLDFTSAANNRDTIMTRFDSLGTGSAYMDVIVNVQTGANNRVAAVFGFVEPGGSNRKYVAAALTKNKLSFGQMDSTTGTWTQLGLGSFTATGQDTIRIRKISGTTPQVQICLNGNVALNLNANQLIPTSSRMAGMSVFFGIQGRAGSGLNVLYKSINYVIGNDGGGCL
jgi:hypothetical protein